MHHAPSGSSTNAASTEIVASKAEATILTEPNVGSAVSLSLSFPPSSDKQPTDRIARPSHKSVSRFYRRLARKSSYFSLRGKARRLEQQKLQTQSNLYTSPESSKGVRFEQDIPCPDLDSGYNQSNNRPANCLVQSQTGAITTAQSSALVHPYQPTLPPRSPSLIHQFQPETRLKAIKSTLDQRALEGHLYQWQSHNQNFNRMASENASPPVPYSRLQEITVSACEKALSSVNAYSHAATEEWNTTIINTILGTLVSETTPTSGSGSSGQPAFKYVVNSTIIQHAPTSSSGSSDPSVTGRRGMHAASGAYWNNEKDGMWSYKYSAAEKKGLDVVVGVTWIWVG